MDVPLLRQKRLCPLQRQLKPPPGDGDSWQLYAVDVMVKCPLPLFVSAFIFSLFICGFFAVEVPAKWIENGWMKGSAE